jgi:sialic acid synthase SpsE
MKIIGDPGSCHLGSFDKASELVRIGANAGLDAVKFQLLTSNETKNGNIGMNWDWLPELIVLGDRLGVEVFASVFDNSGIDWVRKCGCKSIKFAHSQYLKYLQFNVLEKHFENQYVSCDTSNDRIIENAVKLYCIPEYPVRYIIDFEGIFPRFDGFSSHCLGIEQDLKAMIMGAKYLEKHFQGDWESDCPDGAFALRQKDLTRLVDSVKKTTFDSSPSKPHHALGLKA